jgi:hypothetical protein
MFGSSVCLIGLPIGFFLGLLIGSTNQIQSFTGARFPVTELRFMKASPKFAKRKISKSTKNLERAVIAVQSFLFHLLFNIF